MVSPAARGATPPEEKPLFITSEKEVKVKWYKTAKEVCVTDHKGNEIWLETSAKQSKENSYPIQYGVEKGGRVKITTKYVNLFNYVLLSKNSIPSKVSNDPKLLGNYFALEKLYYMMSKLDIPMMNNLNFENFISNVLTIPDLESYTRELDTAASNLKNLQEQFKDNKFLEKQLSFQKQQVNTLIYFPLLNEKLKEFGINFKSITEFTFILKKYQINIDDPDGVLQIVLAKFYDENKSNMTLEWQPFLQLLRKPLGILYPKELIFILDLLNNLPNFFSSWESEFRNINLPSMITYFLLDIKELSKFFSNYNKTTVEKLAKDIEETSKLMPILSPAYKVKEEIRINWPTFSSFLKDIRFSKLDPNEVQKELKDSESIKNLAKNIKIYREHQDSCKEVSINFRDLHSHLKSLPKLTDPNKAAIAFIFDKKYSQLKKDNLIPEYLEREKFIKIMQFQLGNREPSDLLQQLNRLKLIDIILKLDDLQHIEIQNIFSKYNVDRSKLVHYFIYHLNETQVLETRNIKRTDHFELLADKINNMDELNKFYQTRTESSVLKQLWPEFSDFLKDMKYADVNRPELLNIERGGTLDTFLGYLKKEIDFYREHQKTFQDVGSTGLSFARYFRFLKAMPVFRAKVEGWQKTEKEDEEALKGILVDAKNAWVSKEYLQVRSQGVDDLIKKCNLGSSVVRSKPKIPFKEEHLVEIIDYAKDLLAKKTFDTFLHVSKKFTHLALTFSIVPKENRIIIHLKQKFEEASRGASKKVTYAIVVEAGKATVVDADMVVRPGETKKKVLTDTLNEIKFINENQPKDGNPHFPGPIRDIRLTPTSLEYQTEKYVFPDIRAVYTTPYDPTNAKEPGYDFKQRLGLAIGWLKTLRYIHSLGIAQNDSKTANASARRNKEGGLDSFAFDFGSARKLGENIFGGTALFLSPANARGMIDKNGYPSNVSGDLWSYGIGLYEMLCTPAGSNKDKPLYPPFLMPINNLPVGRQVLNQLKNLQQDSVNISIQSIPFVKDGLEGLSDDDRTIVEAQLKPIFIKLLDVGAYDTPGNPTDVDDKVIGMLEKIYNELP